MSGRMRPAPRAQATLAGWQQADPACISLLSAWWEGRTPREGSASVSVVPAEWHRVVPDP